MYMKKISLMLMALFIIGSFVPMVFADVAITNIRYSSVGNYGIVASGVGLDTLVSGEISITIPTTDIVVAYLYWAGYDFVSGGDDTIEFAGNVITADDQFGPDFWLSRYAGTEYDAYHFVYVADVTQYVTGSGTYNVDEFEMDALWPDNTEYGPGLMVVYEDATLPIARVTILDGLDSYWFGFGGDRGPNSEVFSLDFTGYSMERDMEMILFAGGTSGPDDPNKVLTETGSGAKPATLVGAPSVAPWSLTANNGDRWDTYTEEVTVGANDEWLCVQVESVGEKGASGLVIGAGFVLPIPQQYDGLSPGFWKHNIRVALEYPGNYSRPHEGEDKMNYDTIVALAKTATGISDPTLALEAALADLTAKGKGSATVRLAMANAFNAAAGYTPYSD